MTVSTGIEAPVEETGVALGRPLRIALVHGREESSRRAVLHLALASGAEIVTRIRATDPRSFVEAAQALRDARPDVVVLQGGPKEETALAELLEALRLGCGAQRQMPRVFGLVDARAADDLRMRASPFEFQRFGAASAVVELEGLDEIVDHGRRDEAPAERVFRHGLVMPRVHRDRRSSHGLREA